MKKDGDGLVLSNLFQKDCKRGIITEYLPWLLIALAVLAIVMIAIFVLKIEGITLIDKIKSLLRS